MVDGLAATVGQTGRMINSKMDRVYGREIAARIYGGLAAFRNFQTYKNIVEAVKTGESGQAFGRKIGSKSLVSAQMSNKNPFKYPIAALEGTRRVMAGTDELWRNIFRASYMYSEAAREVAATGKRGQGFWDDVNSRVSNPSPEMVAKAQRLTSETLFNETPGKYAQRIMDIQNPRYAPETVIKMVPDANGKMRPTSKTVREANTQPERVAKFAARTVVRFVPTLSSIFRYALKNTGPLAPLSREIRADLRAGGAARQSAISRITSS